MSLESAIEANTAAVVALTSALSAQSAGPIVTPRRAKKEEVAAAIPVPATALAPPPAPAGTVSFKAVADALVELVTKAGRATGVGLLNKFGANKVPELKPEHFAAFIAEAKALLAPPPVEVPAGSDLL